ncbi:MAG: flagellar motor switch protein FliM [Acidobacteriota bacterium]
MPDPLIDVNNAVDDESAAEKTAPPDCSRMGARQEVVTSFRFRKQTRHAHVDFGASKKVHETFAANLADQLSHYFRLQFSISLDEVRQTTYDEFRAEMEGPTCLLSLDVKPTLRQALLELSPTLVFPILEILLGSAPKGTPPPFRALTAIEQKLMDGVFRMVLRELEICWAKVNGVRFALSRVETDPLATLAMPVSESLITFRFRANLEEIGSTIRLALPLPLLKLLNESEAPKAVEPAEKEVDSSQTDILSYIGSGKIRLEAILTGSTIPLQDLANLEPGDLLKLQHPVGRPLVLLANGEHKYQGTILSHKGKRAFAIRGLTANKYV